MPTSSDAQRALMVKWFGSIDATGPIEFLLSHGFNLTDHWCWQLPVSAHNISADEYECLMFLVDEWDFGGIVG